jgi:glycosyltransferase involved in cell wall biosynthesis
MPAFSRWEEREEVEGRELAVHRIVHRHEDARGHRSTWDDRRFDAPIATLIAAFRPDVLHLAHPDGWGRRPTEVARGAGVPVVITLHDYKWICGRGQMIRPPGVVCSRIEEARCTRCLAGQLDRGPLRAAGLHVLSRWAPRRAAALRASAAEADRELAVDHRRLPGRRAVTRWRERGRGLLDALNRAEAVTSPSRFVADRHRAAGLERSVDVVRQGMDRPEVEPAAPGVGFPLRVGWFGNPIPSKGLGFLMQAAAAAPGGALELHVHGADHAQAAAEARAAGLSGVPPCTIVHGAYPQEEAIERMGTVDLVAVPSLWDENAPMVATEARWAGRPLLVSSRGGLPELVRHGIDGWVEPAGDAAAWAERLALCAARPASVAEAAARAPSARTAEVMAEEYVAVYERAISLGSPLDVPGAAHGRHRSIASGDPSGPPA